MPRRVTHRASDALADEITQTRTNRHPDPYITALSSPNPHSTISGSRGLQSTSPGSRGLQSTSPGSCGL